MRGGDGMLPSKSAGVRTAETADPPSQRDKMLGYQKGLLSFIYIPRGLRSNFLATPGTRAAY